MRELNRITEGLCKTFNNAAERHERKIRKEYKLNWASVGLTPAEHQLAIVRMELLYLLRLRMFLRAKTVDGGKEIRIPLNYGER